jgi:O-methyltransferase involved in polyketide biosynthesis
MAAATAKTRVELRGVPETLLWTLYHRALQARQRDGLLHDPKAIELVDAIDYPFAQRFGSSVGQAQFQALRSRAFDREVRRFLSERPGGTVVALGEGLETQFWRVDDGRVRWLGVDLPETIEVRRALLGDGERRRSLACSALDERWMDEVDAGRGVLITAEGLFMYLEPADVHRLVAACARRFPGGALVFDAMPRWFTALSQRGKMKTPGGFVAPAMPWGMDADERGAIEALDPAIAQVRDVPLPRGRGALFGFVAPLLARVPLVGAKRPSITLVRFA